MLTSKYLYFSILISILIYGLYVYIDNLERHQAELKRIDILERKINQKNYQITQARMNSNPCPIPDLNTPKECYIDSHQECKWSVEAERCNAIDY